MYNYGKWLMTILWSLNIVCIHIGLMAAEVGRDLQMTAHFHVSLGGQGSRSLKKKDASMNIYIVWMRHRSTKAHRCWLLICSVSVCLPAMCILIKVSHKYLSLLTSEQEKWDVCSQFGTFHSDFLEKNWRQCGCNMLRKPLRQPASTLLLSAVPVSSFVTQ